MNSRRNQSVLSARSIRSGVAICAALLMVDATAQPSPTPPEPSRPEAALQLWLRLDETSGPSAADASGRHRAPSLVQGASWGADPAGRGLEFDGKQSFVALPPLEGFPAGCTLSARALPRSVKKAARFVELSNGRAADNIIFGRRLATDALEFEAFANGKSCGLILAPGVIENGRWHRYTATVAPAGAGLAVVTLYRDATVVLRQDGYPFPPVVGRTVNRLAASQWPQDEFYHGALADIRIYSRALSAEEIACLP